MQFIQTMMFKKFVLNSKFGNLFNCHGKLYLSEFNKKLIKQEINKSNKFKEIHGTVKYHDAHILIRTPKSKESREATEYEAWPLAVEVMPIFIKAFSVLSKIKDITFKVSAYDPVEGGPRLKANECGLLLFPLCIEYPCIKINLLENILKLHYSSESFDKEIKKQLPKPIENENVLHIGVCCHAARKTLCSHVGPLVAQRLHEMGKKDNNLKQYRILRCSHLGGCLVGGNVMVYGDISPSHGDWFGQINQYNTRTLYNALTKIELGCSNSFANAFLKKHWRGCLGCTREEQVQKYLEDKNEKILTIE